MVVVARPFRDPIIIFACEKPSGKRRPCGGTVLVILEELRVFNFKAVTKESAKSVLL